VRVRTNEVAPDGRMLNTPGARLIVQTPANGVALYNIPCARPSGSDPAYLAFEFEPTVFTFVEAYTKHA
jgi:hypothetical protein